MAGRDSPAGKLPISCQFQKGGGREEPTSIGGSENFQLFQRLAERGDGGRGWDRTSDPYDVNEVFQFPCMSCDFQICININNLGGFDFS